MKVLIVGGAGYLGGALTDLLSETEHEIRIYDNLTYEEDYLKDVPFVLGDIRDHRRLRPHLNWADCVVWLAALVGDGACAINPTLTKKINQDSVKWLVDNFDGRIIFTSTCSVYGAKDEELDEDSETNPLSVYAATKLEAEKYLKDKNAIVFRLGTLFGLGDIHSRIRLDLVVNTLVARAFTDKKLTVFGGEQYRPLLHVKDAAQAIVNAIISTLRGTYNLHLENVKIFDLAKRVQSVVPCELEVVDMNFEDARNYRVNSDRAGDLNTPIRAVDTGIHELVGVMSRIKDINNPRYTNAGFLEANGSN